MGVVDVHVLSSDIISLLCDVHLESHGPQEMLEGGVGWPLVVVRPHKITRFGLSEFYDHESSFCEPSSKLNIIHR